MNTLIDLFVQSIFKPELEVDLQVASTENRLHQGEGA